MRQTSFKAETKALVKEEIFYQISLTGFKNQIAKKSVKYKTTLP